MRATYTRYTTPPGQTAGEGDSRGTDCIHAILGCTIWYPRQIGRDCDSSCDSGRRSVRCAPTPVTSLEDVILNAIFHYRGGDTNVIF